MKRLKVKLTVSLGRESYEQVRVINLDDKCVDSVLSELAKDWAAEMVDSDYEILSEETV